MTADNQAGPTGVVSVARDVIRVSGPDAMSFLQGQLSQDIEALAEGASAWSLLLSPKGRVDAWMRVTRLAADAVLLDTDSGAGEAIATRLNRFKLRTDCEIEPLDWAMTSVRGAAADSHRGDVDARAGAELVVADLGWPGEAGFDVLHAPTLGSADSLGLGELAALDEAALEAQRVGVGRPQVGAEITSDSIPAEFGDDFVQRSVSFTKGCYVGQELVARMASRGGSAPRRLVRVSGSGAAPERSTPILVDGEDKGSITSVTASSAAGGEAGAWEGLAVVHRTVPTGVVQTAAGEVHLSDLEPAG